MPQKTSVRAKNEHDGYDSNRRQLRDNRRLVGSDCPDNPVTHMRTTTLHRLTGRELNALVVKELEARGLKNVKTAMITWWSHGKYVSDMSAIYQENRGEK
jgi:hypothetical protein